MRDRAMGKDRPAPPGPAGRREPPREPGPVRPRIVRPARAPHATRPLDGLLAGLRLALGTGGDPEADTAALSRVADWSAVVDLAERHRVAPLLWKWFRTGAGPLAGSGTGLRLREIQARANVRGFRQLEALKQAAGCLAGNGVPCIVLKGLALTRRIHGHFLGREAIDVDLLVPPHAFPAAERILRDHGWRRLMPDFRETPIRRRWYDALVKDSRFAAPGKAGRGGPAILELHRRPTNNPFLLDTPFERLYGNGATVEIEGHSFRTLGDDDLLPYLACHGLEHYWHRLKWLCDVALLLASTDGERLARVVARCRERRLEIALAPALLLCAEALHAGVPRAAASLPLDGKRTALVARFARRAWEEPPGGLRGVAREVEMQAARIFLKTDLRFSLHELARFAIAPHDFGKIDVPDRLFFLYPVLRPFILLAKRRRGRARTARSPRRAPARTSPRPPGSAS